MKTRKQLSEEDLIYHIGIKSRIGAEALYDQYAKNFFGVICLIIPNKMIAEDILQMALTKIWYSFDSYDPSKGRLFTWMLVLVRNMAKDALRSKQYHKELLTEEIGCHAQQIDRSFHVLFNNDVLMIRSLVTALKKDQKEIIDLVYFKGYTHIEAAEELGIPLGTVKTRCRAAIEKLRSIFIPKRMAAA